jgi:hypothetical protein
MYVTLRIEDIRIEFKYSLISYTQITLLFLWVCALFIYITK